MVSELNGAMVAEAPIQLKDKTTGALVRTSTKPDGSYTFGGLAVGAYQFSIVMPCCAYNRVTREVIVEADKTVHLNISLTETVNGTTLGDDPGRLAAVMRKRAKLPSQPEPRNASGSRTCRAFGWPLMTPIPNCRSHCLGPPQ
jgi:hypothetical protein